MNQLVERLQQETQTPPSPAKLCQGTLLSRKQYLNDVAQQGYQDGREIPFGNMTTQDVALWTEAITDEEHALPQAAERSTPSFDRGDV
jgi:hypothetical protein